VAKRFEDQGAALIHIVDLDGAIAGAPQNLEAIAKIRAAVRCALDVSGGLRTIDSIRDAVVSGADYVSIGSAAFLNPELVRNACAEFPHRIFGSLDIRDGMLAIKGWVETSKLSVTDATRVFRDAGVAAAIVTDIARDGAQSGVDAARMAATASTAAIAIVASGGVSTLDDVVALRERFDDGVVGVIVGRALYEGNFTLEQALRSSR
jgi:phosphoribosylformimino-5-aminoimidazole carboxamide ribotide isomerase